MTVIAIEGIDRIGKSTCCKHLVDNHGFSQLHFGKPEGSTDAERALYQKGTFTNLFSLASAIEGQKAKVVLDRAHLGELVYGPIYRAGSGVDLEYVHDLERKSPGCIKLVLLVHRNLGIVRLRDDGLGFDINRLGEESQTFERAFERSQLRDKHLIDVTEKSISEMLDALERVLGLPERFDVLHPNTLDVRFRKVVPLSFEGDPEFNGA